ncbi:HTH-like domain-containing protein [Roseivivax lentus]|uniref:HTH-like domain-containing protein n=1 Tax=Roseivivax lentus TaxID=633194 RepID=A0A1N7PD86_9RHOB|nr:HTH-like domain-containing protein [Roseivivax lentus]
MPIGLPDEERLTDDIIALTREFGRYGYRMITGMLNNSGWHVNHKRPSRQICAANRLPGSGTNGSGGGRGLKSR